MTGCSVRARILINLSCSAPKKRRRTTYDVSLCAFLSLRSLSTAVANIRSISPSVLCKNSNNPEQWKPNVQDRRSLSRGTMADVSMNNPIGIMSTSRKISFGFNGKLNGVEGKTPFLIGVSGGTASGKSTVCKRIMEKLGQVDMDHTERQVVCISQDSFYRDLTPAEKLKAEKGQFNFDHPDAFDNDLILQTLQDILAGVKCEIPAYDYKTNSLVKDQITTIYPADVVLFEGILVFYFPKIRDLFHMKLFVDTDSDTRLARRVPRDIKERGRDLDYVLNQYMNFVKPAFEEFCLPTKKFADVIIPRGADNTVAIELIVQHIRDLLSNRGRIAVEAECPISHAEGVFKRLH